GFNTPMIIPTGIAQFYQIRDCGSSRNVAFPPLAKAEGLPSSRKLYVLAAYFDLVFHEKIM
ncbi:hypothetical protein ACE1AT_10265, partial [Pelatocladus sp. BLCC-F211]|uniref:hypothetical protein n=1 Tax=Pelatocladus sp. BLCC-F211 TaxID=3342752 RepID=UPI0035BA4D39